MPPGARPLPGRPPSARSAGSLRRLLPVQRPDVESRHPLRTQAVHRRGQPARNGLRLRPGRGYTGLLTGKRAVVVYTSAVYGPERPAAFGTDFQAPYLKNWLAWAGITDTAEVSSGPTSPPPTPRRAGRKPTPPPARPPRSSDQPRAPDPTPARAYRAGGWPRSRAGPLLGRDAATTAPPHRQQPASAGPARASSAATLRERWLSRSRGPATGSYCRIPMVADAPQLHPGAVQIGGNVAGP